METLTLVREKLTIQGMEFSFQSEFEKGQMPVVINFSGVGYDTEGNYMSLNGAYDVNAGKFNQLNGSQVPKEVVTNLVTSITEIYEQFKLA